MAHSIRESAFIGRGILLRAGGDWASATRGEETDWARRDHCLQALSDLAGSSGISP